MTISSEKMLSMLHMQDAINKVVDENWRQSGCDWHRAIMMELCEAVDHHGWKWWKKQDLDSAQLKMELVDVWHFALSVCLRDTDHNSGTAALLAAQVEKDEYVVFKQEDDIDFKTEDLNILELLDLLIGFAARKQFSMEIFHALMKKCDFAWGNMWEQYIGKNTLNKFRQDHGYKDGSYVKIWNGEEDNIHLQRILDELDCESETYVDDVYAKLMVTYDSI